MKDLLLAIKYELMGAVDDVDDASVCIVRHENYLPPTARSPAIGIKDGMVRRRELAGGVVELDMTVFICAWCQIIDQPPGYESASVTGTDDLDGVLAIAADIIARLEHNTLGIEGMQRAFAVECRASEPFGINTTTLQRKIVVMNYVKETAGTCGD